MSTSRPATVTWDGGGGDFSWQTASNWDGDTLPGPDDLVVINMPGVLTVSSSADVSIQSLQCSNNLSIVAGVFSVTANASVIRGDLGLSGATALTADGPGTSFSANGTTTASDADFVVSSGATLSLPGLRNFTKGCVGANWIVTGSNSVLDLPGLTNISGAPCAYPVIQVRAGARLLATNLASITAGPLTFLVDGTDSLIDFRGLRDCAGNGDYPVEFIMDNGGIILAPTLTTLYNVDLKLRSGVLSLPGLKDFAKGCVGANWIVTGSNSVLNFPGLTNISGAPCAYPAIQVTEGGRLLATNLETIVAGPLTFVADGDGSLIDFSGLRYCAGNESYAVNFDARNGGTVKVFASPRPGHAFYIILQMTDGGTVYSPNLATLDDSDLIVSDGVLALPGLRNFTKGCVGANWIVTGSNSVLDLPGLTNISGAPCAYPVIQVRAGARLLATNLASITAGPLTFLVDGTGSLIDFRGLQTCAANADYAIAFDARNGGRMLLTTTGSGATMYGVDLSASGGGVLSLPGVKDFAKGCVGADWTVTGSNSVVDMPALTNISGAPCAYPAIQVTEGGRLLATALATITAGPLTFLADGENSLIDFRGLQTCAGNSGYTINFDARNGGTVNLSSLTNTHQEALVLEVQDEGNMLFAGQTFFITGVAINMPPLAAILPPTLIFHGLPWHSYLIEKRNTLQPQNPWTFVARVAMTNQFHAITSLLPLDTDFRATEFVADPPVLDLQKAAGANVQLVLFGAPNKTYRLQSTNRLPEMPGDWPVLAAVSMTNAFRIFSFAPPQETELFFKARE